jgi:histidyl-tRNA synthetase
VTAQKFKAPRGTFDVLPEQQGVRRRIAHIAARRLEEAGYGRMDTPIFEETDLFARGVGESTDIVQKQMFTFTD